jgi:RNA polymerase sigma factor (sigma-70 family)
MTNHLNTDECSTDAEAIERSIEKPGTFARVFERHFASVYRYVCRRLGPDLADELAAEAFTVAFDRRHTYDLASPDARPWLLGIASNLVRHHWRSERRWLEACERLATALPSGESDPSSRATFSGLDEPLTFSLRSLAKRDREALLLLAWGDLSYEEIAEAINVPIGTVRSRINRARRQMSKALGTRANDPPKAGCAQSAPANHQGDCNG